MTDINKQQAQILKCFFSLFRSTFILILRCLELLDLSALQRWLGYSVPYQVIYSTMAVFLLSYTAFYTFPFQFCVLFFLGRSIEFLYLIYGFRYFNGSRFVNETLKLRQLVVQLLCQFLKRMGNMPSRLILKSSSFYSTMLLGYLKALGFYWLLTLADIYLLISSMLWVCMRNERTLPYFGLSYSLELSL